MKKVQFVAQFIYKVVVNAWERASADNCFWFNVWSKYICSIRIHSRVQDFDLHMLIELQQKLVKYLTK